MVFGSVEVLYPSVLLNEEEYIPRVIPSFFVYGVTVIDKIKIIDRFKSV